MRILIDTLVAVTLIALLSGVAYLHRESREEERAQDAVREAVRRFQQQIHLEAALNRHEGRDRGYPVSVDPEWFNESRPMNLLLGPAHPWVEIADASQAVLLHPRDRAAVDESVASFWYNPYAGIVRGRVPSTVSDAKALRAYNYINDCNLLYLFDED